MEVMNINLLLKLPNSEKKISFEGPRLALVGPSGCGKSTAAKVMVGVSQAGSGSLKLGQDDLMTLPAWQRKIGYTPQDLILFPHLSVRQNLLFPVGAELNTEILEGLSLTPLLDRMPRLLSGGEKQRVALARSLMGHPRLLILDEPFSSLDHKMKERVVTFIHHYTLSQKLNLIFISHDSREIAQLDCASLLF